MAKKRRTKRTYRAETLGLPPLKMVLVHAQNDRLNAAAITSPLGRSGATPRSKRPRTQQEVVIRIIEHLTKDQ